MAVLDVQTSDLARRIELTVTLRLRGYRWWLCRVWIARQLIFCAAWLMGVGIKIVATEKDAADG